MSFAPQAVLPPTLREERSRELFLLEGPLPKGTSIDINNPGPSWQASGETITFEDAADFAQNIKVYRNGQLIDSGTTASGSDVYPIVTGPQNSTMTFNFFLAQHDFIQIWKLIKN